jgi:DNA helicase-2/ATP-dependent DNA helicase PcrA
MEKAENFEESNYTGLYGFLAYIEAMSNSNVSVGEAKNATEDNDVVNIMTVHKSKGLEFPIVFIPEANEGITPYQKAVMQEEIEEERRLFYVAMSRAKELLYVFSVKERFHKTLEVSRFVKEFTQTEETKKR